MAEQVAALLVRVGADVTDMLQGFDRADRATGKLESRLEASVETAKRFGAALGAAGLAAGAGLAAMVKGTLTAADELGKLSQKVGVSVESLSALKYAGELSDVSLEALSTGLKQLAKNIDENDPAFKRLNISLTDSSGRAKTTEQILGEVATRFAGMRDGAGKTALAMELFGKSGADLIPLLNGGADGLREMAEEARRAGVIISTETAKAAEEFNDNLTRLEAQLKGIGMTISGPVIESLSRMTNQLMAAQEASGSWLQGIRTGLSARSVPEQIVNITAELERLRQKRKELANQPPMPIEPFAVPMGESFAADIDQRIAQLEARLKMLQTVHKALEAAEASAQARNSGPKAAPPPREDKEGEAARRAAAQRAKREADERARLMEDQAELVLRAEAERRALEAANAAADREELERRTEHARAKLEQLDTSLLNEQERLAQHYQDQLAQLTEARELGLITEAGYNERAVALEQQHMEEITGIRKRSMTALEKFSQQSFAKQTQTIAGMMADMTSTVANQSKAMFNINKAAGIANVVLKAHESIANAYAFGSSWGGPAGGAAMAALAAAATAAQISSIANTQYGGKSAPSIAGSTAAPAVSPVGGGAGAQGGGQTTFLQINGDDIFTGRTVQKLAKAMIEGQKKGDRFVVT